MLCSYNVCFVTYKINESKETFDFTNLITTILKRISIKSDKEKYLFYKYEKHKQKFLKYMKNFKNFRFFINYIYQGAC